VFRKPEKRSLNSNEKDSKGELSKKKLATDQSSRLPVHKRLLSFGDDDEE
jgi:hypothetical protein